MSGMFGGGLTKFQNGLGGGAAPGMPNLPGMNGEFGGQQQNFPSAGAAAIDYAKNRRVGEIPFDINSNNDVSNPQSSVETGPAQGGSPAANIQRPRFLDVLKQEGTHMSPRLTKGGNFISAVLAAGKGALEGSAGHGFGQGAVIANQQGQAQDQQREANLMRRLELARQQSQDELNQRNVNSEIDLRKAQMNQKAEPSQHVVGGSLVDGTGRVIYQSPAKPDNTNTPYEDFRRGYADTPEGRLKAAQDYIAKTRPPKDGGPSKGQIVASQRHYEQRLDELTREKNSATTLMTPDEFSQRKAQIDADYQSELDTLGATRPSGKNAGPPKGAKVRDYTQLR